MARIHSEFYKGIYLSIQLHFHIAFLKFQDLNTNKISFIRSKTKRTTKGDPKPITAILPDYALNVIKEFGNTSTNKKDYIFNIIGKNDTIEVKTSKITSFIRYTNQHIKNMVKQFNTNLKEKNENKLDQNLLIPEEISTYWARHSFTTQAMRKGARMELLQESLGHKSLATTQNYFAGFDSEVKEELSKSLLDF